MLRSYRRHKANCPHRDKGRLWKRCSCPIWAAGTIDGVEIRKTLRAATWEDAERELEKLKQSPTGPENASPEPATIELAWVQFLKDAAARNLSESTLRKYRYLRDGMQRYAAEHGLRFLVEFDFGELCAWRATWRNKNLSAAKKLQLLKCFLRFADNANWIPHNIHTKLKAPKVTPTPTLPFSREEVSRIFLTAEKFGPTDRSRRRIYALVVLLRYSGLRIGDAVSLARERINEGKLFLYTSKAGTPVYCPLPPFVVTALEAAADAGARYFFWTGNGKLQTATTDYQEKLKSLCGLAGVVGGHAHRFRDTFAVELLLQGVPLERVAVLLGHSSVKITEKHYSPWVRARQEQLELDVRRTWSTDLHASGEGGIPSGEGVGTPSDRTPGVHGKWPLPN